MEPDALDRLAIEFICAFGMPPVDFVRMATSLDVSRIGMAPAPITDNPHGFPAWDLRQDPALVRDMKAALGDSGISLAQGEGFLIMPGLEIADSEPLLDIFVELGAPMVNAVSLEQDRPRAIGQFAKLAEMAEARGMNATLEFMPLMWPATIVEADAFVIESSAANGKLMLDAMHLYRSGGSEADLAAIDPAHIGYAQLCDVPMPEGCAPPPPEQMGSYGEEARQERRRPGDGDLPLDRFLAAVPRDVTIGLETPIFSKAKAGVAPIDAIRPCVEAALSLLAALD
ncbi:MAG: sugar phosphate isomerase/epimerase [Novosphingobium sp.]|nr:sugar phosphate isomerase/epimerase [Novosphingobium sp.]